MLVEAFVAELGVEAFNERILRGFTWGSEVEFHAVLLRPVVQDFAGELGPVVERDGLGQAVGLGQAIQDGDDASPADGQIRPERGTLPGEVIDEGQGAEAATVGELVMDEVHAPAFLGPGGRGYGHAGLGGEFFAELPAQGKLFGAVEPLGAFMVDDQAFGTEDIVEHRTAPARMLGREGFEPFAHRRIVGRLRLILEAGAIPAREATGAALG